MSAKSQEAGERFRKGFNCSQAVLGTFSEQFGLDCDKASKVATGFGGGMRMGGTCGAVTGAFMVLGLKYGNSSAKDKEGRQKHINKSKNIQADSKPGMALSPAGSCLAAI